MNVFDFILLLISACLLAVSQVAMKMWVINKDIIAWPINLHFIRSVFSIEIAVFFLSLVISGFLWLTLLKKIDFSIIYPMLSVTYVFALLASMFIFREHVPAMRWAGVAVIIIGVFMVGKS